MIPSNSSTDQYYSPPIIPPKDIKQALPIAETEHKYTIIEVKLTDREKVAHFMKIMCVIAGFIFTLPAYFVSSNMHKYVDKLFYEFKNGVRRVKVLKTLPPLHSSTKTNTAADGIFSGKSVSIQSTPPPTVAKILPTTTITPIQSATGTVTGANLAQFMQQVVNDHYGQPFPHRDQVVVEHNGKEVLWKDLTPQEKFDVVYEHSLPHNRPKLLKRENFQNDKQWVAHIEDRLFRGSHHPDGTPVIPTGLEHDPRLSHGSDHGMRVALFSAIYAGLYQKYDADVNLTPEDVLTLQLAGAFHDSGRQTEGVDIDDKKSADNAAQNLEQWGFSQVYFKEAAQAISGKDNPQLSTKHVIAKCVQCADSTEYGRVGLFNPKYLDIYKEFNENTNKKALKEGRTLGELNKDIDEVNAEMKKIMTVSSSKRKQFSQPGHNYYSEILNLINSKDHPRIHALLTEMRVIETIKTPIASSTTSSAIMEQAQTLTRPSLPQVKNNEFFPKMLDQIKIISASIGGSTGAKLIEDAEGRKFVQKTAGNKAKIQPDHLRTEYHTNKAYQAIGVRVPEVLLYNRTTSQQIIEGTESTSGNDVIMLSAIVPGKTQELKEYLGYPNVKGNSVKLKEVQTLVQKNFVADCLLANWDVIGLEYDNIRINVETKEIWRIDNGSGLNYRAQGQKKDAKFFNESGVIGEFESLRNPMINPQAALIFGTITNRDIIQQIEDILPRREAFLTTIPDHLKEIMEKRFDYLSVYRDKLIGH
jgi:hypothetical protein